MNHLRRTHIFYDLFHIIVFERKFLQLPSRDKELPLFHSQKLVQLLFKLRFTEPPALRVYPVFGKMIDDRPNSEPHCEMIKHRCECDCQREPKCGKIRFVKDKKYRREHRRDNGNDFKKLTELHKVLRFCQPQSAEIFLTVLAVRMVRNSPMPALAVFFHQFAFA